MGAYRLTAFLRETPAALQRLSIHGDTRLIAGARRGEVIGAGNCLARRLQDTPANHMRPRDMVSEARGRPPGRRRSRWGSSTRRRWRSFGMGALLSVSRGSVEPAYLIHLVYRPAKKARARSAWSARV